MSRAWIAAVALTFGCVPLLPVEALDDPCDACGDGEFCDAARTCRPVGCVGPECQRYLDVAGRWSGFCAVAEDGRVGCWGLHLGPTPQLIDGVTGAERVVVGYADACAIRVDGTVVCWDMPGDAGLPFDGVATEAEFDGPVRRLVVGRDHRCALLEDWRVQCSGTNRGGAFGAPVPPSAPTPQTIALDLEPVADIVGGGHHTCFRHGEAADRLTCYGEDVLGGVASFAFEGTQLVTDDVPPVVVTSTGAHYLDLGNGRARFFEARDDIAYASGPCFVADGGTVECRYQVASDLSFFGTRSDPAVVETASVAKIVYGPWILAIHYADGIIRMLGSNRMGRAGTGALVPQTGRAAPSLPYDVTALEGGLAAGCAVGDGQLHCWGQSAGVDGHIGREGQELSVRPLDVGDGAAKQVVLFGDRAALQRRGLAALVGRGSERTVDIFGPTHLFGMEAWSRVDGAPFLPRRVDALVDAVEIAGGTQVLCGRFEDERVVCLDAERQAELVGLDGATALAVHPSDAYVVAIADGDLACAPWAGSCPIDVPAVTEVVDVDVGESFLVTRHTDGSVVHLDVVQRRLHGQVVVEARGAVSISASTLHACAARGDAGPSVCWGINDRGAISPDRSEAEFATVAPLVLDEAHDTIEAGAGFTCGVERDGDVACWGTNTYCELGVCPELFHETPVLLAVPR